VSPLAILKLVAKMMMQGTTPQKPIVILSMRYQTNINQYLQQFITNQNTFLITLAIVDNENNEQSNLQYYSDLINQWLLHIAMLCHLGFYGFQMLIRGYDRP